MSDKVLIHSRFPKAMLVRIGQRFDVMNAAGKPLTDAFTKEQLAGVRALITAGGTPLGAAAMDTLPKLAAIICYGTGYDGSILRRRLSVASRSATVRRRMHPPLPIWR